MIIEKTLIAYLIDSAVCGNNVYAEVPVKVPNKYIVIQKTSGREDDRLESSTVVIQSVSKKSLQDAAELDAAVKEAMRNIPDNNPIMRAELNSNYNFTNTETKEYRYCAVYILNY